MLVYRIGRTRFAHDLTGEGARLFGGRWNHKLIPCIYTSESRALALLEYTANVNIEDIPRALSITKFEIPNDQIYEIPITELPGNWTQAPAPSSTKAFGSTILERNEYLVIKIASAIVPDEFNFLINPKHRLNSSIEILEVTDFIYDVRLKLK